MSESTPRRISADDLVEATRLALAARHTEEGIVLTDPDGRITWVNDAFVRMTGYERQEAIGRRRLELVRGPFVHTPEFTTLSDDLEAMRPASAEFATRTRDGASYWVSMHVRPVVERGRVVGQVGVERDTTSRRQAQERAKQALRRAESLAIALRQEKAVLSQVLGTIPHSVWWKDADLRYLSANRAYLELRGLGSPAELVGRLESQLEGDLSLAPQLTELEGTVARTRVAVMDTTMTVPGADGRPPRTFLVSVLPLTDRDTFNGVLGIGADVSRVTDLERQLAQTNRLESIGQLAAGIAHEINTPVQYVSDNTRFVAQTLTGVLDGLRQLAVLAEPPTGAPSDPVRDQLRGVVGALDLDFVAEEVPSALAQSLEGLDRVAEIVRAMKEFSHPGGARGEADLNRVVETTVQVSRNEWKYVAELELDLDPEVGLVPCFEGELKQAVLNILVNAAHAVDARRQADGSTEPGHLRVSTRRHGGEAFVVIQDDGTGMDDDTRARVFDPFFTTKDVGKGTGQGLSLAHATVVGKHGGRIEVASTLGRGSTFTIALPYSAQQPDDPDAS